eukprot:883734-Alexandrium_andersonii.AAC.1
MEPLPITDAKEEDSGFQEPFGLPRALLLGSGGRVVFAGVRRARCSCSVSYTHLRAHETSAHL